MRIATRILLLSLALGLFSAVAFASNVPVGFISYDFIGGGLAEFDITNQTGPNSSQFPDETWPVSNSISLSDLSLVVHFADGSQFTYGSGYWSLEPDGLSWAGPQLSDGSEITSATLTGTFSPTLFDLNDGTHFNANPNFSATISDPNNLQNGDFALINATPASGTTPEPGTLALVGTGALGLLRFRRRKLQVNVRKWFGSRTTIAFALCCLLLLPVASRAFASSVVRLNEWTSPSQGYAGTGQVSITGTGFPTGTIFPGNVTVSIWPTTCMSGTPTTTVGLLYRHITGTSGRVQFQIPGTLVAGTYPVSISDTVDGITSSNCSMMKVLIHASVSSCVPGASMGVLVSPPPSTTVTVYVPNGAWCCGTTGIQVAQVEPTGAFLGSISTPDVPNSCSSNSVTGETVCVSNNTDIYRITGTTLNSRVTSLATSYIGFSGGSCANCGVAIDQVNNLAYMQIGIAGSPSGGGIESFNLGTGVQTAFSTFYEPSEDIQVDPGRNWVLSPNESNIYDLIDTSSSPFKEYGFGLSIGGEMDSAAEDCTTGIALATQEFTPNLFITDPTQAVFVGGAPGSWSAPGQSVAFPEFNNMSAGTDGIAVAPGSHLALVTGEFGGNEVGVVTLPSTSGSGTPNFGDYVAAYLPSTPDGNPFSLGYDPHTVTAYQSPGGGFYGLAADWILGSPSYVAVIDLPGLLSAPRCSGNCILGPHEVDPHYDLVAHGIVRYVQVH